jgi:hypothetical protein
MRKLLTYNIITGTPINIYHSSDLKTIQKQEILPVKVEFEPKSSKHTKKDQIPADEPYSK